MHKEIVERKKIPVMLLLFILLITFICLSDLLSKISIGNINIRIFVTIFFSTIMIALCYIEFSRCKVKYKYSIVADQFIIHKIRGEEVTIVEDIKLRNIEFIGNYCNCSANINISSSKRYICSIFIGSKRCCVHKVGDKFKKFYFEPSDGLMNKITLLKQKPLFLNNKQ
jgi:hypothetical protein